MSRADLVVVVFFVTGCGSSASGSGEPSGGSAASSTGSSTATTATSVASSGSSGSGAGGGGGDAATSGAGGGGGMGGAGGGGGQRPTAEECEAYSSTDSAQAAQNCLAAGCRRTVQAQFVHAGIPDVCDDRTFDPPFHLCIQTSEPGTEAKGAFSMWYRFGDDGEVEYIYLSATRCDMLGWIPCDDQDPAHPLCACIPSSCGVEE